MVGITLNFIKLSHVWLKILILNLNRNNNRFYTRIKWLIQLTASNWRFLAFSPKIYTFNSRVRKNFLDTLSLKKLQIWLTSLSIRTKKHWKAIKLWTGFVNLMGFAWTKMEQLKVEFQINSRIWTSNHPKYFYSKNHIFIPIQFHTNLSASISSLQFQNLN